MRYLETLFLLLIASLPMTGQTMGQITGEIRDSSGGVVVSAAVTAVNQATGGTRMASTNEAGVYAIPSLQPGLYNLRVEMRGFRTVMRNDIELEVQQTARVDFNLQVGEVTEIVEVSSSGALLTTENTTVGAVIENRRIVELPLNGRNFVQLVSLSPNVTFLSDRSISIAGQRIGFNRFTLDGAENTDVQTNAYSFLPSIEALQEFKVQTGIYPAEFGRSASQINISTRSGTNEFHGALFEFLRNDKLDAKNYAFTTFRPSKDPFKWNQYGFALGGPVWLPRIFNGRNRLFFMSNFEGFRDRKRLRIIGNVPSVAMREGDFSQLSTRVFDPATRTGQSGSISALQFPGNIIPKSRIHTVSRKLLEFYPEPNINTGGLISNYQTGSGRLINKDQFIQRLDFVESSSSSWFGRYSWADEVTLQPGLKLSGSQTLNRPWQTMISNTRVLSPSFVNEFRFGYSKLSNSSTSELAFQRDVISELNIPGVLPQAPAVWGTPDITVAGFSNFGNGGGPGVANDHVFQWVDNISWTRGKHSLRFGTEIRRDRYNTAQYSFARGQFIFEGLATENPASRAGTGNGFADYLLSYIKNGRAAIAQGFAKFRTTGQFYYIDDMWKVRSNLTVSIGLRYENVPPWFDSAGKFVNVHIPFFDTAANIQDRNRHPTLVRIGSGDFYEGILLRFNPAIQVARDGRMGKRLVNTDYNDFAPRLGIAWSPSPHWTLRVGGGVFYSQDIGTPRADLSRNLSGYRNDEADNDFPDLTFSAPFRNLGSTVQSNTPNVLANNPQRRTAYTMEYMFNVQRALDSNTVLEAGYIGSGTRKLEHYRSFNTAIPSPTGSILSRLPYPEFGRLYLVDAMGKGNYHSLALKGQRRFSSGLTYLVGYTWSKAIDLGSGIRTAGTDVQFPQDEYCMQCDRGLSFFHTSHRLVSSILYEPPFGKGRPYLNTGPARLFFGGWEIGSIITLQTGLPLTVISGRDQANTAHQYQRPSATGLPTALPRGQQDPQRFFNTGAFVLQPFGTLGNLGRNTVIGPGTISWDFSTTKSIPIHESHRLQFRFEAFNLPNHPNWGTPNLTVVDVSFGSIRSTGTNMRELQFALKYIF